MQFTILDEIWTKVRNLGYILDEIGGFGRMKKMTFWTGYFFCPKHAGRTIQKLMQTLKALELFDEIRVSTMV